MVAREIFYYPLTQTVFWSLITIILYIAAKKIYQVFPKWWLAPLAVTPLLVMIVVVALRSDYSHYITATHWLMLILGPVTVAFAIPIWKERETIRNNWFVLLVGVFVGSLTAMLSAWGLAHLFRFDNSLTLSLMPRSMSTPFAMTVSGDIGGVPDLTAIFVVLTGVFGGALGELLMKIMPLHSNVARGALFGMGAHGVGVATAHRIGSEEGSIAGLVMVMVGIVNVLAAPLVGWFLS